MAFLRVETAGFGGVWFALVFGEMEMVDGAFYEHNFYEYNSDHNDKKETRGQ